MAILSDEFYYQPIRIDAINTRVFADIVAKEGDANGRGLLLTLTENGLMKDTTGIALNLKWEHTSVGNQGLDNFEAVDPSKGLYKITYPTEMLNRGTVRAFIQIIDSGKLVGTRNIGITVDRGVGDDTAIASSDSFTALAQALIDVNNLESTYAPELLSVKQQLAEKVGDGKLATMADLGQDVKTAITGGSVAVVGDNTVIESNIVNKQVSPSKFVDSYNMMSIATLKLGTVLAGYDTGTLLPTYITDGTTTGAFTAQIATPLVGKLRVKLSEITQGLALMILDGDGKRLNHFTLANVKSSAVAYIVSSALYYEIDIAKLKVAYPTVGFIVAEFLTVNKPTIYIKGLKTVNLLDYEWAASDGVSKIVDDAIDNNPSYPFDEKGLPQTVAYNYAQLEKAIKDIKIYGGSKTDKFYVLNAHKYYSGTYSAYFLTIGIAKVGYTGGAVGNELVCNFAINVSEIDFVTDKLTVMTLTQNNSSVIYSAKLYVNFSEFPQDSPAAVIAKTVMPIANTCIVESSTKSVSDPTEIVLPAKIVIAQGRELNLYYDNILKNNVGSNIIRGSVNSFDKFFKGSARRLSSATPTGLLSAYTSLWVDGKTQPTYVKDTALYVVPTATGTGLNKKVLIIGDSLTDNNAMADEIFNLFGPDVMDITMLGTRGNTGKHEGRAGWSAYNYVHSASVTIGGTTLTNPFYNPATSTFDLAYYMANNGYAAVDYVLICLGTNDIGSTSDADYKAAIDTIIASVKAYNATAKIGLWINPLPAQVEDNLYKKNSFLTFMQKTITNYDNREAEKIYLMPVYLNLDTENDFTVSSQALSARNSLMVNRLVDKIHPATAGYYKFADILFSYIKYFAI